MDYPMVLKILVVAPTMKEAQEVLDLISIHEKNVQRRTSYTLVGDNYIYYALPLDTCSKAGRVDQLIVVNKEEVLASEKFTQVVLPLVHSLKRLPKEFYEYRVQYWS